mgnify:CR=1 FL=1
MAYNTRAIKTDLNQKPIPQVYNPVTDEYEPLQGSAASGNRVQLYDGDGNPVGAATDAKLEAARLLLASLDNKDYATQTTLAGVLAKLADPATAAKQDAATAVLDAISTAVATRATEATLEQIKVALTDGTLKAQLSGSRIEIETIINAASVAPSTTLAWTAIPANGCDAVHLAFSCDKQWKAYINSPFADVDNTRGLYPERFFTTQDATAANYYRMSLVTHAGQYGATAVTAADAYGMVAPWSTLKLKTQNPSATDTMTMTVRVLRIWKH